MYDLVIRGGRVVDGTGAPARTADVAIRNGRVREVGARLARGRREIDADGLLVAPGWVDVHTHYDGNAFWDPLMSPSSSHGVTTVVTGNCGVGLAPVRRENLDWVIALMEGVEDIPGDVLSEGLPWNWESFPEYLNVLDAVPRAIDVGTQVPHSALRVFAMGEKGIDHTVRPSSDEIRLMGQLAAEAILAGALGFSTSRSSTHRTLDGRVTPTLSASEAELTGIAAAIGRTGRGVFEAVFEGDISDQLALLRRMCEVSGRPLSLSTQQRPGQPTDAYRTMLRAFERAAADGLSVRGQVAPRPVGLLMSLKGRVHPLSGSATFKALAPEQRSDVQLLRADVRARILSELTATDPDPMAQFARAFVLGDPPSWDRDVQNSIERLAAARGETQTAVAYDIVAGGGVIYVPVSNYENGTMDAIHEMLLHPLTVPGLGDGGAHCTLIADFDFPTFLLSYWARDADERHRLPIEFVVQQQCAATAELVGLTDRGRIEPGLKADINLIDFYNLNTGSPHLIDDLPTGGSRLVSPATGYVATIVAGEVAFEGGVHTGALAGELVRGAGGSL
jgi:N-acyl-D-aspartate/D-glutamate deacylase